MRRMPSKLVLRVTGPIIAISVLLLLMGIAAAVYVQRLQRDLSLIIAGNVSSVEAIQKFAEVIREVENSIKLFVATHNYDHVRTILDRRNDAGIWLFKSAEQTDSTAYERELIGAVKRGFLHFFED